MAVLAVLTGVLAVLVGVPAILVGVLDCPLHWDLSHYSAFVTRDRALRTWVGVTGILIKKNVRISVYIL